MFQKAHQFATQLSWALDGISMMQAVIFDVDGTLIDSESMGKQVEKQVFSSMGVEVTEFWYSHFPWSDKSLEQVENEVVDRVAELLSDEGVQEILSFFQSKKF
ncbi:MAG: beta-phosphoglucomutase-like phosphatase (HAD superfamily) [Candidatus Azotimanducaceae bacterium]